MNLNHAILVHRQLGDKITTQKAMLDPLEVIQTAHVRTHVSLGVVQTKQKFHKITHNLL